MPIIVDGHNLIGKMSTLSLADPRDEEKLVELLVKHLRHIRQKAIVVFDKGSDQDFTPTQRGPKLKIIFAPPGSCADAIIMDMIRRDPNPKGLTIVSSDNEIRHCARSRRARLVSAEDFARELESKRGHRASSRRREDKADNMNIAEWSDFFRKGRA